MPLPCPTAASLASILKLDAANFELNAYVRRPDVAEQRRACYGVKPPKPARRATEAEVIEAALLLDAGIPPSPWVWAERMQQPVAQAARVAA